MDRTAFITRLGPTESEALRASARLHGRSLSKELAQAVRSHLAAVAAENDHGSRGNGSRVESPPIGEPFTGKTWRQRKEIAEGALRDALYVPDPGRVAGQRVLVFDDVFTEASPSERSPGRSGSRAPPKCPRSCWRGSRSAGEIRVKTDAGAERSRAESSGTRSRTGSGIPL